MHRQAQPAREVLDLVAQVRTHAGQQHRELERLGHIVVGTRVETEDHVGIGVVAGQHDDRALEAALAQHLACFAAVHVRQPYVQENQVQMIALDGIDALGRSGSRNDFELVMKCQLVLQGLTKVLVVIDDENRLLVRHDRPLQKAG